MLEYVFFRNLSLVFGEHIVLSSLMPLKELGGLLCCEINNSK